MPHPKHKIQSIAMTCQTTLLIFQTNYMYHSYSISQANIYHHHLPSTQHTSPQKPPSKAASPNNKPRRIKSPLSSRTHHLPYIGHPTPPHSSLRTNYPITPPTSPLGVEELEIERRTHLPAPRCRFRALLSCRTRTEGRIRRRGDDD